LQDWLARLDAAPLVSLDTETTDLDPMQARLVGISFAIDGGPAAYLPLGHHYAGAPEQLPLVPTLENSNPGWNRHATPSSASTSSMTAMCSPTTM
jgi:DNA polymerase-1